MSRFAADNEAQRAVRDAVIGPGLYGPYSLNGRYVHIDKGALASEIQQRYAVDSVLQSRRSGGAIFVEEKIVRWPGYRYEALALETQSCTVPGRESDGWMVYGRADWLNYAMCQANGDVLCHLMPFQKLREAFWPVADQFPLTVTSQLNRTACRVVPLSWIEQSGIGLWSIALRASPAAAKVVIEYNQQHYLNWRARALR